MNEENKSIIRRNSEDFLTILSGKRIISPKSEFQIGYNNALGDMFDYVLNEYKDYLYPSTLRQGKWERD